MMVSVLHVELIKLLHKHRDICKELLQIFDDHGTYSEIMHEEFCEVLNIIVSGETYPGYDDSDKISIDEVLGTKV